MPQPVLDTMQEHLSLEATIGGYEAKAQVEPQLHRTYEAIAELINADSDEIAIVENATRAWTMAFYAIQFQAGDRILTSVAEYASNMIAFLQVKQKVDISVEVVPNDAYGQVDVNVLRQMIDERVKLIAISHIPSQNGLIQPANAIGQIANQYGALFLLDACQSVGQLAIDVHQIGCHMLSATGRKYLRGPRGIGFLYVASNVMSQLEPPLLDLHSATWVSADSYQLKPTATRFENWEMNIAAKLGLGVAVEYALNLGIDEIQTRVQSLASTLRQQLADIPKVTVRDVGQHQSGIVTFTVDGHDANTIKSALHEHHINTSMTPRAYAINDFDARGIESVVRASVHYYNSEAEIERFCAVLSGMTS